MSRLSYKSFLCKTCGIPINPSVMTNSREIAYQEGPNGLRKTPAIVASCESGHVGVFPMFQAVEAYMKYISEITPFYVGRVKWVKHFILKEKILTPEEVRLAEVCERD